MPRAEASGTHAAERLGYTCGMRVRNIAGLLLACLLACLLGLAAAQSIRVGVVVDRSGPAADAALDAAIGAFQARTASAGGVFGAPFEVLVRDGRSDPNHIRGELQRLVQQDGVHAIVCCDSQPAVRVAREVAEEHGVLVLALGAGDGGSAGWLFGLGADDRTELRAVVSHVYAEGKRALGLMTLENAFGNAPVRVLEEELPVADMELIAVERYPPDARMLTPEALWIATRLPGAVVVWGLAPDTAVAVDALRRRGYEGPLYVRSGLLADDSGWERIARNRVRAAVAPVVADGSTSQASDSSAAAVLSDMLFTLYGVRDVTAAAGRAYDGLALLRDAAEQAALYGVPPDDVAGYRLALRDAAVALPPYLGAGGAYDLEERSDQAALPSGLIVVEATDGRLIPLAP